LLHQVNLWDVRKKALAGFSGGMRQRFGIAQALLGQPQLIIVDEPTAGLDPEERNRFLNLLAEIGENVVVILSTHIVEDVADLCPNMAIIANGRIVKTGAPLELIDALEGACGARTIGKQELDEYRRAHEVIATRLFGGRTVIHVLADERPGEGFEPMQGGLEDVYFSTLAVNTTASGLRPVNVRLCRHVRAALSAQVPCLLGHICHVLLLTFGATASDNVQIGAGGNVLVNSPYAIAQTLLVMCIFALFIMTAFVANVVIRDDETGFGPISPFDADLALRLPVRPIYRRVRRRLPGIRECAARHDARRSPMPWIDPETVGPFNLAHYAWVYLLMCVPTLFVMGAGFFALATATRSMMWTYVA
jgi:hypothetical protein